MTALDKIIKEFREELRDSDDFWHGVVEMIEDWKKEAPDQCDVIICPEGHALVTLPGVDAVVSLPFKFADVTHPSEISCVNDATMEHLTEELAALEKMAAEVGGLIETVKASMRRSESIKGRGQPWQGQ